MVFQKHRQPFFKTSCLKLLNPKDIYSMKELILKFSTFFLYSIGSAFTSTLQHLRSSITPLMPVLLPDRPGFFLRPQKSGNNIGAFYSVLPVRL